MVRVISVISGKGGVGKTFLSINLANSLAKQNKRALIIDLDLFHANVQIYLDQTNILTNSYFTSLNDILSNNSNFKDGLYKHKQGFYVVPSSIVLEDVINLDIDEYQVRSLIDNYAQHFDYIIIDTPPGINEISKIAIKSTDYSIIVSSNSRIDMIDNLKMINYAKSFNNTVLGFVANKYNEFDSYNRKELISFFNLPELGKIPYLRTNDLNYILKNKDVFNSTVNITQSIDKILS